MGTAAIDATRADERGRTSGGSSASIEQLTKRSSVALMTKSPAMRGLGRSGHSCRGHTGPTRSGCVIGFGSICVCVGSRAGTWVMYR